jgi:3-isopropylmalate/(R)-2-methylmalate dehydratase small subunit
MLAMKKVITGRTHVFGNNIDTDQIYPGRYLELVDPEEIAKYCMEGARPTFVRDFVSGDIVVGGTNFGCGSSREHAAIALKSIGAGAVIAKSFARIFYRNAINLGLTLIICPEIGKLGLNDEREEITIDIEKGTVANSSTGAQIFCEPISEYAMKILESGGIKNMIREQYKKQNREDY